MGAFDPVERAVHRRSGISDRRVGVSERVTLSTAS
jgi:hypothetical protein